jgi:hypothetical protein
MSSYVGTGPHRYHSVQGVDRNGLALLRLAMLRAAITYATSSAHLAQATC